MTGDSTPREISTPSSASQTRQHSLAGRVKHGQPRPRQNVKFSVDASDEDNNSPERHHSLSAVDQLESNSASDELSLVPNTIPNLQEWAWKKDVAAETARAKANRLSDKVKRNNSAPTSRRSSFDRASTLAGFSSPYISPLQKALIDHPVRLDDIPLVDIGPRSRPRVFDLPGESTDDSDDNDTAEVVKSKTRQARDDQNVDEAKNLVRSFTNGAGYLASSTQRIEKLSGAMTPLMDQQSHEFDYIPRPKQYKPSVLSILLASKSAPSGNNVHTIKQQESYLDSKLAPFTNPQTDPRKHHVDFFDRNRKDKLTSPDHLSGTASLVGNSNVSSGITTPKHKRPKWYRDESTRTSTGSLSKLLESASQAAMGPAVPESVRTSERPHMPRSASSGRLDAAIHMLKNSVNHIRSPSSASNAHLDLQAANIADRLASQEYLLMMCRALMQLGAPTHRLEEYMQMAARKLCIHGSFQYLPNCMIVSFDDPVTHTTELHLVKEPPNVDLGKLKDMQEVYKGVIHDKYSIADAMDDIQMVLNKPKKFRTPTLILLYGIAAVAVGPFAFSSRPIDFPIAFVLGTVLGTLQLLLSPRSSQFSHVFEVAGTFVTSLAARGFGSILDSSGTPIFCFSALAQSSIALILPGWIILSAALELQSRNMIAGSIRMVYAIIYTLFLGFGILIGTTMMGLMYPQSTNDITCHMPSYWTVNSPSESWRLLYTKFIWVPIFTICLAMINQAKWKQMPWMVVISTVGYQVNYWSAQRFSQNIQVANALGAFAIGTLANLYSRFRHGVAAAAMLPAIFVMVPSGLAASGSLVAGLTSANQITHNVTGISIVNNGTQGFYDAQNATTSQGNGSDVYGGTIFNVGYGMVQVAIGISVGLFLSALVIYPFGKRRSGLFSF